MRANVCRRRPASDVWFDLGLALLVAGLALLIAFDATRFAVGRGELLALLMLPAVAGFALGWIFRGGPRRASEPAPPAAPAEAGSDEAQRLLVNIIDSVEASVMTVSSAGTITSFSAVAERTLGYGAADVVGQHFGAVFPNIPENAELRDMILTALTARRTYSSVEVNAATADGTPVALGVTLSLLRDETGQLRGIVLTFKNLGELNRLREQVRRTDQLASLGRLSAGMAHEIRNPLGSLSGLVELLQEDFAEGDPRRQYTKTILRTISQLNSLVENLLEFSHPPVTRSETCDIRDLTSEAVRLCAFEQRGRPVFLNETYSPEPVNALVDRESLTRAIVNIVRNAYQATPDNGAVSASVRHGRVAPDGSREAFIAIHNDGSYVPPGDREKLFTPFFTTKSSGTGLGLPISHQIVAAHSGRIEIESGTKSGTTFRIVLPAGSGVPAGMEQAAPASALRRMEEALA